MHYEISPARVTKRSEIFADDPISVITEADVLDVGKDMLPQLAVGQKLVISLFISSKRYCL